ncbi:MAG: helix-turn-helix transcriptional regulator, partial [Chloroflexi bacterium]|nr:helix-turn-helix transcriptional regulator [Chloroflexota bacterium]
MADSAEHIFSLGPWVRRRRKALDLTQAALARRVGCAEVTIRKLEADAIRPSRTIAERLVRCLDLDPSDRAIFLQVASGERSVTCLTTPVSGIEMLPLEAALVAPSVVRLPVDTLPDLAPLPPGSYMPLRRNPLFIGREHDLRQLAAMLNGSGTAATAQQEIAAVTGLGGIGKTQLACEFVHRYGQFFTGGVFWLSFADPTAIRAEVAACGGVGGMQLSPEFGALPLDEQVRQVQRAWKRPTPRLLIFDNCEDAALLDQWQPQHGGCRVLITSRRQHWDPALGVQAVPLDVLSRQSSIGLLRTFRADLPDDSTDLDAIAETLGDLPLALYLAGSFLAKYRHALTPAQYLQRLRSSTLLDDHSLRAAGLSPTRHVQHVARTFEQSYERLDLADPTDALARTLLVRAACFAPGESIPRWLLLQTLGSAVDPDAALRAEDALNR